MIRFIISLLAIVGAFAAIREDLVHIVPVFITLSRDTATISKPMFMLAISIQVLHRGDYIMCSFSPQAMSIIPIL